MTRTLAGLLRLAARVICLIVIASFVVFVVNQTSSASTHQQHEISGEGSASGGSPASTAKRKSTLHRTLDETSDALTSPFSGITSGWSSQWAIRGAKLLLALLVYGFGLGFLARFIRVKV